MRPQPGFLFPSFPGFAIELLQNLSLLALETVGNQPFAVRAVLNSTNMIASE